MYARAVSPQETGLAHTDGGRVDQASVRSQLPRQALLAPVIDRAPQCLSRRAAPVHCSHRRCIEGLPDSGNSSLSQSSLTMISSGATPVVIRGAIVVGSSACLIRQPQHEDKRAVQARHVSPVQPADSRADPLPPDRHGLVGHDLGCGPTGRPSMRTHRSAAAVRRSWSSASTLRDPVRRERSDDEGMDGDADPPRTDDARVASLICSHFRGVPLSAP